MSNVVSAAIVSGELIIGLDDGSIIRAGYVQGPQGLKGDQGPMGATGARGTDGSTIHTVKGPPPADLGKDGDYAINNRDWFIFGPKASGLWGAGQGMLPKQQKPIEAGKGGTTATGGGGGGGSGGSGGPIYTNTVQLTAPTRTLLATTTGYRVLPDPGSGKQNQEDANRWAFGEVFDHIDQAIPVHTGELPPPTMPGFIDVYDGRLWFKTLNDENRLYIYDDGEWLPCTEIPPVIFSEGPPDPADSKEGYLYFDTSEDDGTLYVFYSGQWVPAAPPVSTEGLENNVSLLNEAVQGLQATASTHTLQIADAQSTQYGLAQAAAVTAENVQELQTSQAVQDNQIIELEEEIESLAPSLDRGKWNLAELGAGITLAAGQYAMGIGANRVYCEEGYEQCLLAIGGNPNDDPAALAECNRIWGECFSAADGDGEYYMNDWSHATFLHFHKIDSEGKEHTFSDYEVGMFIDLFDQGDTGFAVFEITAAPTLDGDVYTIGVTPIQHEGEASGLARIKVFGLAGADPTDFVRKTGDTMTGRLNIEPTAGSVSLKVVSNPNASNTQNIVDVYNNNGNQVFWVDSLRAGLTSSSARPSTSYHLTDKKYVDETITAALAAPARLEWKVFVNLDGTPQQGLAYLNGASMSDTTVIRLHKQAMNSPVPIKGHGSGLTMYKYSPAPKFYHSTILSAWSDTGTDWQWKGTAEIEEIKLFSEYIQIKLGAHRWSNMNFTNTGSYRFTVGGFF